MSLTMLAKCGFADPDRKDPMHDAACAYVVHNRASICKALYKNNYKEGSEIPHRQEVIINKGHSQYLTTIGFVDIIFVPCVKIFKDDNTYYNYRVGIEVKWSECSISDAIRQVSLYNSYRDFTLIDDWAIAAPWDLNEEGRRALNSQHIAYIHLDRNNVCDFAKRLRETKAIADVSI